MIATGMPELLTRISEAAADTTLTILLLGRFQPPHNGHLDAICRVTLRDFSIISEPADRTWVESFDSVNVIPVILDIVEPLNRNPIDVMTRRLMIEESLRIDFQVGPIRTETVPSQLCDRNLIQYIASILPRRGPVAVASDNSVLLRECDACRTRALRISNRHLNGAISASRIRELIALGHDRDIKNYVPATVYKILADGDWFSHLREIFSGN